MKFLSYLGITLFCAMAHASIYEKCVCPKKDGQEAIARACESNINVTNLRVECLASARLVATVEFCSRQYGSAQDRLTCIQKVDRTNP
jgi:hypothetical protein